MSIELRFPFRKKPEQAAVSPTAAELAQMLGSRLVAANKIDDLISVLTEMKASGQKFEFNVPPTVDFPDFLPGETGNISQFLSTLESIQRMAPEARDPITLTQINNAIQTLPLTAGIQEKVSRNIKDVYLGGVQQIDVRGMLPPKPTAEIPRAEVMTPAEALPEVQRNLGIQRLVELEERLLAIEENREMLPKERLQDPDTPFEEVMNILKGMADRQVILVDEEGNAFATNALFGLANDALTQFRGREFLSDKDFKQVIRAINLLPKQFLLRAHVFKEISRWYDEVAADNGLTIDFPPLKPIERA